MVDIFKKPNVLNKLLLMKHTNIVRWIEKVQRFVKKLSLHELGIKIDIFKLFLNYQDQIIILTS